VDRHHGQRVLRAPATRPQRPGAAPVTLVDGAALGRLLDEHAVLVQHATVSLPSLDVDLYDALRSV
jgi:restriction endonuclease Mrr